jgi:rubredoxin
MSREELSMQNAPYAPSASMGNLYIQPQLLPVCCICGFVRDEAGGRPQHGRWVAPRAYLKIHGRNLADFPLTHTYCPKCLVKVQKTVQQYLHEERTTR